ncbi:GNAT family N-acetyltransferase [Lysobacter antibioticus]|uniref:Acetyltransferase family protein n=1 Tax=Lysobacter antibioticus TaxID=84531 RepID=A0A0S2FDS0_LYSAN|nr:GNAT family N-acetyltransferase [Lysobacter antibioticus]ALN81692.1 acetyltransferase family protein [Lysobacter antibioticus]
MSAPSLRRYRAEDRAACLALFDSNVPDYFAELERADFIRTLDEIDGEIVAYWVIELEGEGIVACGGYAASDGDASIAVLCWGMVRRDLHRRGLGERLLRERLSRIDAEPAFAWSVLETTQHSRAFYARHGFRAMREQRDGFAPGFDLVEMRRPRNGVVDGEG